MSSSASAAHRADQYDDLEAGKPLRGRADYARSNENNGYVPTAETVRTNGSSDDAFVPMAETIDGYDVAVRHGFVRKVFGILFVQLLATFAYVLLCTYHAGMRGYMATNPGWPIGLGLVLSFGTLFSMACFGDAARSYPTNYGLLGVFTFAESLLLGVIAAQHDAEVVALAVGTTMAVVAGLVLFATQIKYDFTSAAPYLYMALWTFVIYGLIAALFGLQGGRVYAALGTLLFSAYLVFDVQLVLGGKHKQYSFGVDDYVFAALAIYLDIINLFLYILRLLDSRN